MLKDQIGDGKQEVGDSQTGCQYVRRVLSEVWVADKEQNDQRVQNASQYAEYEDDDSPGFRVLAQKWILCDELLLRKARPGIKYSMW